MIFFILLISKELSSSCPNRINPESTDIKDSEFENCLQLEGTLNIPEKVISIGNYAFYHCVNLNGQLILHDKIKKIGEHAFDGCIHLTGSLELPNDLSSLGDGAFYGCTGFTGSLKIPAYFSSSIPRYCFFKCTGFNELILTNYYNDNMYKYRKEHYSDSFWQKILDKSYRNSQVSYEFMYYKPRLMEIGEYAFYECSGLKTINLLNSITDIKKFAFYQCTNLEKINIWYINETFDTYLLSKSNSLTLPNAITLIGESAFANCFKLKEPLTIPKTLYKIEDNAFRNCYSIEGTLSILGSTIIGDHAFDGCSSFTSLELGNSISNIGSYAFYGCNGFNCSLKIPENLNVINDYVFDGCSGFYGSLKILKQVIHIGNGAFKNCYGFNESLEFYNVETKICSYAFYNCSGFRGPLLIPGFTNTIEDYTFFNCSGFSGLLQLPIKLNKIGKYAFSNCSGFSDSLYIPENTIQICSYAFSGCTGLNGILTISKSVELIGENAFLSNKFIKIVYNGELEPICNKSIGILNDEIVFVKKYYQNNSFCYLQIQNSDILQKKKLDIKKQRNDFAKVDQTPNNFSQNIMNEIIEPSNNKNDYNFSKFNTSQRVQHLNQILPIKNANMIKLTNENNDEINNIIFTNDNSYANQIKIGYFLMPMIIIIPLISIINKYLTINKSEKIIQNEEIKIDTSKSNSYNFIDIDTLKKLKLKGCQQIGNKSVYIVSKNPYYVIKELANNENYIKFFTEYDIIRHLNHINIIKTYGFCPADSSYPSSILLEYFPFNLSNLIDKLSNEEKISIIYEISVAMSYVHKKKIIHRDLKPSNILIDEKKHVKICDFGISKAVVNDMTTYTHQIGTLKFMAPEMYNEMEDEPYGFEVDVYSFGIIVFMILSNGHFPDKSNNLFERYKINNISKELIEKCRSISPKDRPTFDEIVNYIKNHNFRLINEVNIDLVRLHLCEIYSDI